MCVYIYIYIYIHIYLYIHIYIHKQTVLPTAARREVQRLAAELLDLVGRLVIVLILISNSTIIISIISISIISISIISWAALLV